MLHKNLKQKHLSVHFHNLVIWLILLWLVLLIVSINDGFMSFLWYFLVEKKDAIKILKKDKKLHGDLESNQQSKKKLNVKKKSKWKKRK